MLVFLSQLTELPYILNQDRPKSHCMTTVFNDYASSIHQTFYLSFIVKPMRWKAFSVLFLKKINKNVFCVKIKIDEVGRYFVIVFPKAAAAITAAVLVRTSVLLY